MKHKGKGKSRVLITLQMLLVLVALLSSAVGTVAYYADRGTAENFLFSRTMKVDLIDDFTNDQSTLPGDTLNKDVSLKNNGEMNAFVRVQLTPSWTPSEDSKGNALLTNAVTVVLGSNSDWTLIPGDEPIYDWYYYNKVLKPGESTSKLVDGLYLSAVSNDSHATNYSGATYKLLVDSDYLTANPLAVEQWAVSCVVTGDAITWSAPPPPPPTTTTTTTTSSENTGE